MFHPRRSSTVPRVATLVIVSSMVLLLSVTTSQAQCLRRWYVSIQEGNSNIVTPFHGIQFYRNKINEWGFEAVKVWPRWQGPSNAEFAALMQDPSIAVVVYRPLHQSGYPQNIFPHWENIDYGTVANQLYSLYGNIPKIVILTGWEQDNQYNWNSPGMPFQDYLDLLNARQSGVQNARAANSNAALTVYHAVEVNKVPDQVTPSSQNVLHQFVPLMTDPPDMISYSAWGGLNNIETKLDVIMNASGLPRDRIFIGEFGYQIKATSHNSVANFLSRARTWGARLILLWQFNQGEVYTKHDVYPEPGTSVGAGYTTEAGTGNPIALDTINAVKAARDFSKVCGQYW